MSLMNAVIMVFMFMLKPRCVLTVRTLDGDILNLVPDTRIAVKNGMARLQNMNILNSDTCLVRETSQ